MMISFTMYNKLKWSLFTFLGPPYKLVGPKLIFSANEVYLFVLFIYLNKRKGLKASSIDNGKTLV